MPALLSAQHNPEVERRIDSIMARMELVDKVGEMTQLAIDMLSVGEPYKVKEPHTLDMAKLRKALVEYRVGSILNVGGHAYTREHWHHIITTIQEVATREKPSGIPVLYGIDAIHGANYSQGSTLFPQQIGLAATWNPALAYETGRIAAAETRSCGIPWTFSPVLDNGRNPLWSRLWETFGEDVLLSSDMGEAIVRGYQGENIGDPQRVAACMKHFMGYGLNQTGKDRSPAYIPDRQLRELVMPPFQRAIDAGAATVMVCSGEINGIPVHIDRRILTDILRHEMGFEGIIVTDWEDIKFLYTRHRVAANYKEAIKLAILAGIDMSMVPNDLEFPKLLRELVEEGQVPMSRIDDAVRRILRLKIALNLFENPFPPKGEDDAYGSEAHAAASRLAASECLTLLKNDTQILPLNKAARVLVTGPTAHSLNYLNGGWTGTWQGDDPKYNTPGKLTILEAIQEKIGEQQVTYVAGTDIAEPLDVAAAVEAAAQVDVVVVCLGEATYTEKPGDIDDLSLPEPQLDLVRALVTAGKPIVLVLAQGRPRIIREIEPMTEAILLAYLPGNEGAPAIADVLFGDVNPSGRLPYTYPRFPNDLVTYDHKHTEDQSRVYDTNAFNPQYPFGFGLSYTQFIYDKLKLDSDTLRAGQTLSVTIELTNSGDMDGQEVVQLYVTDEVASITPPVRRLRGFDKVFVSAGDSVELVFELVAEDLAFVGLNNEWITEPGWFTLSIGGEKTRFYYAGK